jgi:hypothetical protein
MKKPAIYAGGLDMGRLVGIEPPEAKETRNLSDYKRLKVQEIHTIADP